MVKRAFYGPSGYLEEVYSIIKWYPKPNCTTGSELGSCRAARHSPARRELHPLSSPCGLDCLEHSQGASLVLPSSSFIVGQRNLSSLTQTLTTAKKKMELEQTSPGHKVLKASRLLHHCLPLLFRLSLSRNNIYIVRVHYCQHYFLCAFSCRKWQSFFLKRKYQHFRLLFSWYSIVYGVARDLLFKRKDKHVLHCHWKLLLLHLTIFVVLFWINNLMTEQFCLEWYSCSLGN